MEYPPPKCRIIKKNVQSGFLIKNSHLISLAVYILGLLARVNVKNYIKLQTY